MNTPLQKPGGQKPAQAASTPAAPSGNRRAWLETWKQPGVAQDTALVGAAATLFLFVVSRTIDLGSIHLGLLTFNDQIVYLSTARRLAETGVLSSSIIYPSTLLQTATKNYFYMPGHFVVLAASYVLFGYGIWQSLLPNLAAYVLAAAAVYLVARRYYDRPVAWAAAALFMFFPPDLVYAFSAMSEMTRVAVTVMAFAVFIYLPARWQYLAGPWLVAIPFLFRETGAFLIAPMALVLFDQQRRHNLWRVAGFVVYGVAVLSWLYASAWSAGRPTLVPTYVFDTSFTTMHTDAVAQHLLSTRPLADWLNRMPPKVWASAVSIVQAFIWAPHSFLVVWSCVLFGLTLAAVIGARYWQDRFFLAAAVLALVHLVFLFTLYTEFTYGWLRILLALAPFLVIVAAALIHRLIRPGRAPASRVPPAVQWTAVTLAAIVSLVAVRHFFLPAAATSALDAQRTAWLEKIGHDDATLLVAPVDFFDYVDKHYPVTWAFLPANGQTLDLLAARYTIGTVIVGSEPSSLRPADFARDGFVFEQSAVVHGTTYQVYRRRASALGSVNTDLTP